MSIWIEPTFTIIHLLFAIAFPIAVYLMWFIKVNRGKLLDRFNLIWRRSRTIKVNLQTSSGRTIERYIVPDKRGLLHIGNGVYVFVREASTINARYNIPEISLLESQIHPPIPEIMATDISEIEVKVVQPDGSFKNEKRNIPAFALSFARLMPEKLKGHVAQEMKMALDSHIVEDVLTASDRTMKKIEIMFILLIGLAGLVLIIGIVLYSMLHQLQIDMEVIRFAATETKG